MFWSFASERWHLLTACLCFKAYIRALEKQERNHQLQQEETLAVGVANSKVRVLFTQQPGAIAIRVWVPRLCADFETS